MQVRRSGYYAWRAKPQSARALEDRRLLGLIKHAWLESGTVYGYRKVTSDLRDLGDPPRQDSCRVFWFSTTVGGGRMRARSESLFDRAQGVGVATDDAAG